MAGLSNDICSLPLEWRISRFSEIAYNTYKYSSDFIFLANQKIRLSVERRSIHCYWFCLESLKRISSDLIIHWDFCFVDKWGRKALVEQGSDTFTYSSISAGGYFIFVKELDIRREGKFLLVDNTLIVHCTLSAKDDDLPNVDTKFTHRIGLESSMLLKNLSSDYEKLYEAQTDTDCVLKVGNTKFPAHRTVLSARSSVFAAMFHYDTAESSNGEANLLGVDSTTLSDILHHVYCGKIRGLTAETAVSMFIFADKYALLDLRKACIKFLLENLTLSNICEVALLCHAHAEEVLENKVVSFMDENVKLLLESSEWKEFLAVKPAVAAKFLSAAYLASKK